MIGIPARYEIRKKHGLDKASCEAKVRETLKELPWVSIGFIENAFDYRTPGSMLTFAERVTIYVGATEILVRSQCLFPAQFIDFGKNKQNVLNFLKLYENSF